MKRTDFAQVRGFSMVELMVASAIGLVLTLVVGTLFAMTSKTYRVADSVGELQETGRAVMGALERDVRMAGYRGCNSNAVKGSSSFVNTIQNPGDYLNRFDAFVTGYDASGGSWSPALPTQVSGATPAPNTGSDVLTVRIVSTNAVALSAQMTNASDDIALQTAAGFVVGQNVIVSDCAQTSAFQVSAISGNSLKHTSGLNSTADLQRAFGIDALVMPFSTVSYYVGASTKQPTGIETSLWRMSDDGAPVELVENVEDLQVLFGEDVNGDYFADRYVRADQVGNPANVVALQVAVLLRGPRDHETQTLQLYDFNGVSGVTPADQRLRRAYTFNIQLRNKTL